MLNKKNINQQKLDFLEHLLAKNEQILLQYEQFFQFDESVDIYVENCELDSLVKKLYVKSESIDTNEWIENLDYSYNNAINKQLKNYKLYNYIPRLPALRDEFSKARLV